MREKVIKNSIAIIFSLALLFIMAACGNTQAPVQSNEISHPPPTTTDPTPGLQSTPPHGTQFSGNQQESHPADDILPELEVAYDDETFYVELYLTKSGNLYGFMDEYNTILIPCQYRDAREFSNGYAAVSNGNDWGFIDKAGRVVIPYEYQDSHDYAGGLFPVKKSGYWGCVNSNNETIVDFLYNDGINNGWRYYGMGDIQYSMIPVCINGAYGVIDSDGNYIIPLESGTWISLITDSFIVRRQKWGPNNQAEFFSLYNLKGEMIRATIGTVFGYSERVIYLSTFDWDSSSGITRQTNIEHIILSANGSVIPLPEDVEYLTAALAGSRRINENAPYIHGWIPVLKSTDSSYPNRFISFVNSDGEFLFHWLDRQIYGEYATKAASPFGSFTITGEINGIHSINIFNSYGETAYEAQSSQGRLGYSLMYFEGFNGACFSVSDANVTVGYTIVNLDSGFALTFEDVTITGPRTAIVSDGIFRGLVVNGKLVYPVEFTRIGYDRNSDTYTLEKGADRTLVRVNINGSITNLDTGVTWNHQNEQSVDSPTGSSNENIIPALASITIKFPVGNQEKSVSLKWGADLFRNSADVFSDDLALLSAALCGATYNIDGGAKRNGHYIEQAFLTLGFPDGNICLYSYPDNPKNQDGRNNNPNVPGADDNDLAYAIASRDIRIDGEDASLLVIALRGTQGAGDIQIDRDTRAVLFKQDYIAWNGPYRFYTDVQKGLEAYYRNHALKEKRYYLIVGHSLGGAAAQLVSAALQIEGGHADSSKIYTYTIGSLNPIVMRSDASVLGMMTGDIDIDWVSNWIHENLAIPENGVIGSFDNIFNIVNPGGDDYIDYPSQAFSKFGKILAVPSIDSWGQVADVSEFTLSYKAIMGGTDRNAINNKGKHEKEVYIAWIKSTPTYGSKVIGWIYAPAS